MSHSLPSSPERGFTLIEATISMALLLIVLLMSMTFLMSMRTFSQRQELVTQPRQTARRALDYLTYYVRGATDMNETAQAPNAIVCFYQSGVNARQATFNNISNAGYGDVGTDMISLAAPTWDAKALFPVTYIPPASSSPSKLNFTAGCGSTSDVTANLNLFKNLTGAHTEGGATVSRLLSVSDSSGAWTYYKITGYPSTSTCTGTENITITSNPTTLITPPGGAAGLSNPNLMFVQYATFRIKNAQLQQKADLFDSGIATATEDANFNTLLPDVEDLQIAYIYDNGNIYNANSTAWSTSNQGGLMSTTGNVPTQAGPTGTPGALDVTSVIGLRVSVVARSARIPTSMGRFTKNFYARPASEDRAAGTFDETDVRFHYRLTSIILLRNRALGM